MEVQEETTETTTDAAENTDKNRRLVINFAELFGEDHDTPDQELVVVPAKPRRRRRRKSAKLSDDNKPSSSSGFGELLSLMSEDELIITIDRIEKSVITMSDKLPDGGAKLRAKLQTLEDELKRRQQRRSQQISANGHKKAMRSEGSSIAGTLDGSKQAVPSSEAPSLFASCFLNKLDDDNPKLEQNTTNQGSNSFNREISCVNPFGKSKKSAGKLPQSKKANPGLFSKKFSAWRPGGSSPHNGGKYMQLNGKLAGTVSSTGSLPLLRQKSAGSSIDEDDSQDLDLNGSKNKKTVVLVDEEEPELIERKQEAKELPSRLSEGKIYYPSREDPESLEIFHSELKCLEPGECLTSTIMNFYVRYLQERCSGSSQSSFYFFNTYFYSKLQEAMEYQKNDQEAFFMKFRRWWKGVNIFQKAYIFLPINEDNHWSLVIICIPDEEGASGLIILHLDSLGLHSSASIFDNIKSLLKNEWKILNDDVGSVNIPFPEKIWRHLPGRIEHKSIMDKMFSVNGEQVLTDRFVAYRLTTVIQYRPHFSNVPRQTNDYDCGLFVLYYMERFMQDAPERLTKQDYSRFSKNWFKPQYASSLRKKIKVILEEKFQEALEQDKHTFDPVCLSKKAETAKAECAEIS